ncbi:hypothetical protein CERSUDRAFT_109780 [Gelatoporia subvermispora B]|uniref:Uncharacterized protein n=2 Tax=Dikarya TaxID=451864 RepID=M2QXC0_CERS8|nr:hypothetical protein CERSUDRAFT_109780 [Gelatoporia subvermispora B]
MTLEQACSPEYWRAQYYPDLPAKGVLAGCVSVARVRPRTSKGITDLLLPQTSIGLSRYRLRSRSLSQLSRQITPPTKNGHAPPPTKSRKSSQSVNPHRVWTW